MKTTLTTTALGLILTAGAAGAQDLRFMCYQDGSECAAWDAQMPAFEAANPGITVTVDEVPYQSIIESLPVQLEVGEGPDLARVTDYGGLARFMLDVRPYVSDADAIEARYGQSLAWARVGNNEDGIYNIVDQLTATGGFRQQDPVRSGGCRDARTGRHMVRVGRGLSRRARRRGRRFRHGHRPHRPPFRRAGHVVRREYFDENGDPILVDDGFRTFAEQFVAWHEDGTLARDVWAGAGGGTYQDAASEFINANLAMYYSGSWQIGRFGRDIGDAFDWVATGGICGPAACTGMPGGAGIVGFKQTEHPEAVGKLLEFMARDDVQAEVLAQTRNIPANSVLQEQGIDYTDVSDDVKAALTEFAASIPTFADSAYALQGYANNRAIYTSTPARITQAIVGELSLEDALTRLDADIAEAVAQ